MTEEITQDPYADPETYDLEGGEFELDGTVLLDLALQAGGPVLELGCGTGIVTIPLAERGVDVTGLDVAPQMIERAKFKAGHAPVRWVVADARSFSLGKQFALIYTAGAVFQHLLTRPDQEAMLARVREHLLPGGHFVMDVGFRHPRYLIDLPDAVEWYTYTDARGRTVQVSGTDHFDHLKQLWTQTMYPRVQDEPGAGPLPPVELVLRYLMPQEMEALLHHNGFAILARYGGWEGSPQTDECHTHIYLCAKRDE
jgi:SAM-dependent methyltransferase